MDHRKFAEVISELNLVMESDHFLVHYGLRNPPLGRGLGAAGISDAGLVRCYVNALERLYEVMVSPPRSRSAPITDGSGRTHVYVCDLDAVGVGSPFTTADRQRVPFIALPCRSPEPSTDALMRRAAADAVHEATHVFNATERPFHRRADFYWWAWVNEALATFMEGCVLPGSHDYFRFLGEWIDLPGVSLNDWRTAYSACLFFEYLAYRMGPRVVDEVWTRAGQQEQPLAALGRLLAAEGVIFASSRPGDEDLFAHGYAVDSYFLRDHRSAFFPAELWQRFGDRAVAETFEVGADTQARATGRLPHLASHYYRCLPARGVDRLRVSVQVGTGSHTNLKAQVVVARPDLSRGARTVLLPAPGNPEERGCLVAELGDVGRFDADHLMLVVTNCGVQELPMDNLVPAGDAYEVEIAAE